MDTLVTININKENRNEIDWGVLVSVRRQISSEI